MKEFNEEYKQIAYLILQNKYLQLMGISNESELNILSKSNQFFPNDWTIKYGIDKRINMLSKAIKENKNLIEIEEETILYKK